MEAFFWRQIVLENQLEFFLNSRKRIRNLRVNILQLRLSAIEQKTYSEITIFLFYFFVNSLII